MKLLEATLQSTPIARPIPTETSPQGLCLDRGYDYDTVRELAVAQRLCHTSARAVRSWQPRSATHPGARGAGS
jgi:hypothetical protein